MTSPSEKRSIAEASGWVYFHSDDLGLECAKKQTAAGTRIMTEDKILYKEPEVAILGGEVPRVVHVLKKVFGGDVVDTGVTFLHQ